MPRITVALVVECGHYQDPFCRTRVGSDPDHLVKCLSLTPGKAEVRRVLGVLGVEHSGCRW